MTTNNTQNFGYGSGIGGVLQQYIPIYGLYNNWKKGQAMAKLGYTGRFNRKGQWTNKQTMNNLGIQAGGSLLGGAIARSGISVTEDGNDVYIDQHNPALINIGNGISYASMAIPAFMTSADFGDFVDLATKKVMATKGLTDFKSTRKQVKKALYKGDLDAEILKGVDLNNLNGVQNHSRSENKGNRMITNFNDLSATLAQVQMSMKKESVKDELRLFDARYDFSRDVLGIGQTLQNFSIRNKKSKFVNFDEYDPDDHSNDPDVVAGSDRMRGYVANAQWQTEQDRMNKQKLNNELNAINDAAGVWKAQQEQNIASRQAELDSAEEQLHQMENNLEDREDALNARESALNDTQRRIQENNKVPDRQIIPSLKAEADARPPIEENSLLEQNSEDELVKNNETADIVVNDDEGVPISVEQGEAQTLVKQIGSTGNANGLLARLSDFAVKHGIPQGTIESISKHKVGIGLGITATIVAIVALVKLLKKNKKINKTELKQVVSGGQGVNNVTQVTETLNSANPNSKTAGISA